MASALTTLDYPHGDCCGDSTAALQGGYAMAFLSSDQLEALGFKHLGRNVRISDKAAIYNTDQIERSESVV